MLKYIIVVTGSQNTGKTSSLIQFWDLLPCANNDRTILRQLADDDFIGLDPSFPISRRPRRFSKVGLNTRGDDKYLVFKGLYTLMNVQSDIIVTACRSEEMFLKAIELFKIFIPTSTMLTNGIDRGKLNEYHDELTSSDVEIIFTSHYQKYIPKNLRTKTINPVNSIVGGVDLNRVFVHHLVALIERLQK